MEVLDVKYMRRFNLGNYEHEEYSTTAILQEGDTAADVFNQLKLEVAAAHKGESNESITGEQDNGPDEDRPVSKQKQSKGKDIESDDGPPDEVEEEAEADEEIEVEDEQPEEEEEAPEKKIKAKAPKKSFKKKPQVYQRTNDVHKELFSSLLKAVAPDWKKDEKSKVRAKEASVKMEGAEFLDESGDVLDSFKTAVKKFMAGKK